jgi:hypothetical protein
MSIPGSIASQYFQTNPAFYQEANVSGGNPLRPLRRRIDTGLGIRGAAQVAFGNEMEDERQGAIRRAAVLTDPANAPGRLDAVSRRNIADAIEMARAGDPLLQSLGLGAGAREGAVRARTGQAQRATNEAVADTYSSSGQLAALKDHLQVIGLAQDPSIVALLAQLEGAMQSSNMMKDQDQDLLGGIVGTIGQIAGMGGFGGGGGGGQRQTQTPSGVSMPATIPSPGTWSLPVSYPRI